MTMPLYMSDAFGYPTAMALATVIGIAFGFVLERAGFGRATTLAAQFYGTDLRVLKVMFSAIVTAAIGLGALAGLGAVDLSLLSIPETFVGPHLVGGLLLGIGFVISGYCPGTAVVAAGSGRVDGLYTILGVGFGALLFGWVFPWIEGFYSAGALGVVTLPELLGVPWAVVAAAVVAMAIGAFLFGEWVERWSARRNGTEPPAGLARVRSAVFAGFVVVAGIGLVGAGAGEAGGTTAASARTFAQLGPIELAEQLVAGEAPVYLVDLRSPETCAAKRIPGALCLSPDDPDGDFLADLPPTRLLVLYDQQALTALPAAAHRFPGSVAVVAGGFAAFERSVLRAPDPPSEATGEALRRYQLESALHDHFTGTRTQRPAPQPRPRAVKRKVKKGGGC